ncbi:L-threonylcarbamoyladenylate synthase [Chlamydia vaughanii]|uniref:L-threonylcarbamoyladenylate synthase n=1 Tax=Chlamydia vaughanii TaxID=3112552 RepID=UPI0032B1E8DA
MFSPDQALFIKKASEHLQQGKVIAFPTDTVYGLGVALNSQNAELQIYTLKQRDAKKPLVVYVNTIEDIEKISGCSLSENASKLAQKFFPGPITILVDHKNPRFHQEKLGFRIISVPVIKQLINISGPLFGTSANLSNFPPAVTSDDVLEDFSTENIFVIPGQCDYGLESTVICSDPLTIYREGIISKKTIEEAIGKNIEMCEHGKHPFCRYVKIHTVGNESHLKEFLKLHPNFQGIICEQPQPRNFYPTLRKALKASEPTVIFIYDRLNSIYPELLPYLTPYTFTTNSK